MTQKDAQAITVRGAWHGEANDPKRHFEGTIIDSEYAGIRRGTRARITFGHSNARSQSAEEHGTYTLVAGSRSLPLMSFTCRTVGTTGRHVTDQSQEDDWLAVPLAG